MFGPSKWYSKGGIKVGGSHSRFHCIGGCFLYPHSARKDPKLMEPPTWLLQSQRAQPLLIYCRRRKINYLQYGLGFRA